MVAAIYYAQIHGTEEFGGDYPSIVPMLPAGEMAGAPHLTWSDEKYPDNTVIAIEIAGCYRRYHSPLARTVCIGKPNPKVSEVARLLLKDWKQLSIQSSREFILKKQNWLSGMY